ncbi:alpha/beta hydrolase [Streptomyces sp. NPDC046887]|uniref:alpha/beta fold hydrolase n=1 Tax=Streptomyces sp. NPDC046887 TaxID=3155472 RepID=UPI0033DD1AAF
MSQEHSQGAGRTARTRDGRELFYRELPGPGNVSSTDPAASSGDPAAGPSTDPSAAPVTVVFEGGLAAGLSYWAPVQRAVAKAARAVVYDRSGLGRSPADPAPRPLSRLAEDLGELLDHLGPGPYLLVGHSWGGPVVRLAAGARPERIAGLVLVDPTDEDCELVYAPATRRAERVGQLASSWLARLGLLAFAYRGVLAALPPDAAADMRAEGFTVAAMRTRAAELGSVVPDLRAMQAAPPELGNLPVTVISAGRTSPGMGPRVRVAVTAANAERAARSPRGRHVVAEEADHMVPIGAPELVAAEVLRLLETAAGAGKAVGAGEAVGAEEGDIGA